MPSLAAGEESVDFSWPSYDKLQTMTYSTLVKIRTIELWGNKKAQLVAVRITLNNGETSQLFGSKNIEKAKKYEKKELYNLKKPRRLQMDCLNACYAIKIENEAGDTMV